MATFSDKSLSFSKLSIQPKHLVLRKYIIFKRSVVGQHIVARLISWDHHQDCKIEEKGRICIISIIRSMQPIKIIYIWNILLPKIDGIFFLNLNIYHLIFSSLVAYFKNCINEEKYSFRMYLITRLFIA